MGNVGDIERITQNRVVKLLDLCRGGRVTGRPTATPQKNH